MNSTNTVVNLSSVALSETETKVLSKGLNFCPTPGKIDSILLEDDLDKLARSFRIKEYFSKDTTTTFNNLSSEENEAVRLLKNRDDIIIKPADKSSAVIVMDRCDHIQKKERQLSDERFYKKLDSDPHPSIQQRDHHKPEKHV
ncbi:uncharacterized protein [Mytilus edulis]|uniref:uncharacterized protein n=1 Tax=Mytilus edulis TaxID=6550 RepID=UPI0039EDF9E4